MILGEGYAREGVEVLSLGGAVRGSELASHRKQVTFVTKNTYSSLKLLPPRLSPAITSTPLASAVSTIVTAS